MPAKYEYTYTYDDGTWNNLLTKVGDKTISYDAQDNPTSYLGHTLTWEKGRQLKSFNGNTYTYNANGIRTSKTVYGVKHTYTLDGTKILRETWGDNTLIPLYDNEDSICGIIYNDEPYYFRKNLQGDIISITDKDAKDVAKYSYDAWGVCNVTSDTTEIGIATVNPFRYRGYYYDMEIGMYYLQSRYYDAAVGRFVNGDEPILMLISRYNLFAYCNNNPSINSDFYGYAQITIILKKDFLRDVVTASVSAIGAIIATYISGGNAYAGIIGAALGWIFGGQISRTYINKDIKFSIWIPFAKSNTYTIW